MRRALGQFVAHDSNITFVPIARCEAVDLKVWRMLMNGRKVMANGFGEISVEHRAIH
jgi:hypothetical protein